ncbi:MAG: NAD(P)-binding domain-containing protein [Geodermatophilaceae bacterium]
MFTPRGFSRLPGLPFPAGPGDYPSKGEVAAYLQSYAARFALPIQLDTRVEVLAASGRGFVASTSQGQIRTRHVVVATGPFHGAYVPDAATGLGSNVRQLHSVDYRRPADIDAPDVLVVGGGNSAAQLACELAPTHRVTMASPRRPWFLPQVIAGVGLYRWLRLTGTLAAKSDARVSRYIRGRGDPIIGRELAYRVNSGQDGSRITTSAVLWCTGFRPDYEWVQLSAALDADGLPIHHRGGSPVPGLHWMGLPWQTRLNSSLVDGVDRDARDLVARLHG